MTGRRRGQWRGLQDRRVNDEAVREIVILIWEDSDRICGNRPKATLPYFIGFTDRHGHLGPDPEGRARVLSASMATLETLLKPVRAAVPSRRE